MPIGFENKNNYTVGYVKVLFVSNVVKVIVDQQLDGTGTDAIHKNQVGYEVRGDQVRMVVNDQSNRKLCDYQKYDVYRDASNVPFTSMAALITYLDAGL